MQDISLGIDLGGTKIELIALNPGGETLMRKRVHTPQGDYLATLDAIIDLVNQARASLGTINRIGLGTPGALSTLSGTIKNANSTCLNGKPLKHDLEQRLNCTVTVCNDANCFALSEAVDGAGRGHSVVFGVIVGTGTGAGIVVNGQVLTGPNAIAGEWGHNPLPWPSQREMPGPPCYCGKHGCIETFLSGPGMTNDHFAINQQTLSAEQIVKNAQQGDNACEQTLQRYEERMARALAHVINILDPHVIVLGGGLSNIARLYHTVPTLWGRYVFSDSVNTLLLPPKHGDSSGVRGAAWL